MEMKRIFLFLSLVVLCIAASSIHLHRSTLKQYGELQQLAQADGPEAAKAGFRNLAMHYPYTVAGASAARQLVDNGASPVGLVLEILKAGVRNTTLREWLVLVSAFLVVVVFLGSNALPASTLLLFALSAAAMFHLSHPMISVDSGALGLFLALNPYFYTALTLFAAAGYIRNRWDIAGHMAYQNVFVRGNLTLSEQILAKEIYAQKLKALYNDVALLDKELQTSHGRYFVKEVQRLHDTMVKDLENKERELENTGARCLQMLETAEETIGRTREELLENRIRLKSKAIDRREYRRIRLEKEAVLKQSRRQIAEVRAKLVSMKKVHLGNRLQFRRRDLFLAYLHESFIARYDSAGHLRTADRLTFHPKMARNNIRRLKVLYRKSSAIDARLSKLEQRRGRMKEKTYRARLAPLASEKKIVDRELADLTGRISEQMESCRKQQAALDATLQALSAELADVKSLRAVKTCFPTHIESRRLTIIQGIRTGRGILPVLQKVEKIYGEAA